MMRTAEANALFGIYCALWKRAEDDGVWVHYDGLPTPANGGYHPREEDPGAGAMITISRPYYEEQDHPTRGRNAGAPATMPPPDILGETITLAHEYGHHLSHLAGNRTPAYVTAVIQIERYYAGEDVPPLTDEEKRLVREEEVRAWAFGRAVLTQLAFDHFDAFDAHEKNARAQYEEIFRWEVLPWHIAALEDWCMNAGAADPASSAFIAARKQYYEAVENHLADEGERRGSFVNRIWPSEKKVIETFRAHRAKRAALNDLRSAMDAYVKTLDEERGRISTVRATTPFVKQSARCDGQ